MPNGAIVWITGLPSSGKSTFAARLAEKLSAFGSTPCTLDGDQIRDCLVPRPGYDATGRSNFYETLTRLAIALAAQGLTVLVPATAGSLSVRQEARRRSGVFLEVFIDVPLETCQARDAKGLYALGQAGGAATLPGAGSRYEPPSDPEVVARGGEDGGALECVLALLEERGRAPLSRP